MTENSHKRRSFTIPMKLEAIKYAEEISGEAAARKYKVDPATIRDWRKLKQSYERVKKSEVMEETLSKKRRRLKGGGRQPFNKELDSLVFSWITSQREKSLRVSRRLIREKAIELYPTVANHDIRAEFKASVGWLRRFMKRNALSLRRKTSVAQKDPAQLFEKIVSFIMYVNSLRKKFKINPEEIVAMDETALFFDMVGDSTVTMKGANTVQLKSTGHEKMHFTVVLAGKGDGKKMKPYIVFKGGIREVKKLQDIKDVIVVSSVNGWMNDELTSDWISKVYQKFSFRRRMLIWDSYKCHISGSTKAHLAKFNSELAVIPGGCTKYIQAPDVSWNKPFKSHVRDRYDKWMASDNNKEKTKGGNLKAPARRLVVEWVKSAWDSISTDLIRKSFKACGQTTCKDGNDDEEIHCLKEGQPCFPAFTLLREARENEKEIELLEIEECEEENEKNEFLIDLSDGEDIEEELDELPDLPDYESQSSSDSN